MKNLKLLLVALVLGLSTTGVAKGEKFADPSSVSAEIENLLTEQNYKAQKDFSVTVFFSVSEDNRIQSLNVASSDERVNQFLLKNLENRKLEGEIWMSGKIYELTVVLT